CTPFVVRGWGHSLVPAAPRGPGQHLATGLSGGQHQAPKEATHLGHTQRTPRLCAALQAASLVAAPGHHIFWGLASSCRGRARPTARSAYAHMAKVLGRSQPVHLRTASCSQPPAPCAASPRLTSVQRAPAVGTAPAQAGAWEAKTTKAVRAVGARRLRRT